MSLRTTSRSPYRRASSTVLNVPTKTRVQYPRPCSSTVSHNGCSPALTRRDINLLAWSLSGNEATCSVNWTAPKSVLDSAACGHVGMASTVKKRKSLKRIGPSGTCFVLGVQICGWQEEKLGRVKS